MQFKWHNNVASTIYQDALRIRECVFVDEQNVAPELEIDELETRCDYVVMYDGDVPMATARIYHDGNVTKIQRVAVLKMFRGQHVGKQLMQEVERFAKEKGYAYLKLGAQNHAIPFYEKLGFQICSEEYSDAGILHHDMEKLIQ